MFLEKLFGKKDKKEGGSKMSMFCYQCQEAAKGEGCQIQGVCGKKEGTAKLQDLLIYSTKGIAEVVTKGNLDVNELKLKKTFG